MVGYGKLNGNGYLMSSQKKKDDTWHPLVNFEKDSNGDYFRWYNQDGTGNLAKIQAEDEANALKEGEANITAAINDILVTYKVKGTDYQFSGKLEAQNRIAVALMKTTGNANKSQNWFTADGQKVKLKNTDLTNILALIDVQMEATLEA